MIANRNVDTRHGSMGGEEWDRDEEVARKGDRAKKKKKRERERTISFLFFDAGFSTMLELIYGSLTYTTLTYTAQGRAIATLGPSI